MNVTCNSLLSLCLRMITLIRVAQLTPGPFVPSSVSFQTNLWKYKSCEKETSSPHICPSLPPSVSLHSITSIHLSHNPPISNSGVLSSSCVHPSFVCLSTCKTPAGSYLSARVSLCVLYVCDELAFRRAINIYCVLHMSMLSLSSGSYAWAQRYFLTSI